MKKYRVKKYLQENKKYHYHVQKKWMCLIWRNMWYSVHNGCYPHRRFFYSYFSEEDALGQIEQFKLGKGFR